MRESDLVKHLQSQTKRRVGLLALQDVQGGPARVHSRLKELAAGGVEIAVLDCTSDRDLEILSEGIRDLPLVTGSSALGIRLPLSWKTKVADRLRISSDSARRGFLVVAGSYSEATRRQNEWIAENGGTVFSLDAMELATHDDFAVPTELCKLLSEDRTCLLKITRNREEVHRFFKEKGETEIQAGERIAAGLARVVQETVSIRPPKGLVLAGGETASTIARVLGFRALQVGTNIEPGVPLCATTAGSPLPVVFKSGNFGRDDFYGRAIKAIQSLTS